MTFYRRSFHKNPSPPPKITFPETTSSPNANPHLFLVNTIQNGGIFQPAMVVCRFFVTLPETNKTTYCWWLKSCTTWDVWNPINNGINYLSTGAGFQPSTVAPKHLTQGTSFRFNAMPSRKDQLKFHIRIRRPCDAQPRPFVRQQNAAGQRRFYISNSNGTQHNLKKLNGAQNENKKGVLKLFFFNGVNKI